MLYDDAEYAGVKKQECLLLCYECFQYKQKLGSLFT